MSAWEIGDLLEAMLLLAQVTRMGFDDELERIFELGTTHAAKALRIDRDYGIEEGKRADLVILEAPSHPRGDPTATPSTGRD